MSLDYQKTPGEQPQQTEVRLDELKLQNYLQQLRDNQNLTMGILAGAAAALLGAIAWGIITAVTEYQIGFMAVGIGFIVGWSVRTFGRGIDKSFAIAGAALSLVGCAIGNLLSSCIFISKEMEISIGDVLSMLDVTAAVEIMKGTFSPMDVLFYALALYFGYKYSLLTIPEDKLKEMLRPV